MRLGLVDLRKKVLPQLQGERQWSRLDFWQQDQCMGFSAESGLTRVYDAFFGADSIYLERGRRDDLFSIQNGRHRIKVAMDLGWKMIPVRAKDLRGL
jgi:hypothetical protein